MKKNRSVLSVLSALAVFAGLVSCEKNPAVKSPCPEAVNLGLPSGVKWASFNLGASRPEEYGGYYQWAGTQDVSDTGIHLDWNNCPYVDENGYSKYVPSGMSSYWSGTGAPDNKTVLDPEDDAVHVKLGGTWRMPTDAEWKELQENCTWTWTDDYNGTKVAGRIVTSNIEGYTDASIFLPAAGLRSGGIFRNVGSSGVYQSSSLGMGFSGNPGYTCYAEFSSGGVYRSTEGGRYFGLSVRPVSE